jgi:hypothetical protein
MQMTSSISERLIKRKIKEAIQSLLIGKTNAKEKVFVSRSVPVDVEDLPAILIYSTSENVRRFNEAPKDYQRELTVAVECLATGNDDDDLDLKLEVLGETVESLMEIDETLGDIVHKVELTGTGYTQDPDGQSPLGSLVLQFAVTFYTDAIRPGSICLPDFKEIGVDWKVGHHGSEEPGTQVDAQSLLTIET